MASSLEMTEMYDNALFGILQHVGNIQDFLQVYFSFLYRKTDFYRLTSSSADKMGFPPGVAEKIVLKKFKLFEKVAEQARERQLSEFQRRKQGKSVPPAVQELKISSDSQADAAHPSTEEVQRKTTSEMKNAFSPAPTAPAQDGQPCNIPTKQSAEGVQAAAAPSSKTHKYQSDSDSYNGAVRENYSWSQDATDVEVHVFVPKRVVKGRQVSVKLQSGNVRVSVKDGAEHKTLMEGEFTHKINTEYSLWSLEPGKYVNLSLNKTSDIWWNAVVKGAKEIDINKIHKERSMETVDEEEHAVLERLKFDYEQKLHGKPQSHNLKVQEMLKKGWDAEGSPFKGSQFDPSHV